MSQPHGFLYACGLLFVMFTVLKFRRKEFDFISRSVVVLMQR